MRRVYLLLISLGLMLFLAVSALLARALSADGAERSAISGLVEAEARGELASMVSQLEGCRTSASCRARVIGEIAALKHSGRITILQIQPSSGFSLTGTLGTARVAWSVESLAPIVQCVRVRRAGDVLRGIRIELLEISPRIATDGVCPARF